jgi:hypothetical protein
MELTSTDTGKELLADIAMLAAELARVEARIADRRLAYADVVRNEAPIPHRSSSTD